MATKRPSSITRQPPELQAEVARLVREGWTIDGIVAELAKLGAVVSRSAMGRHVKHARECMERYSQAQEVSKVWLERLDADPQGDVARLLPEMLRSVAFQTIDGLMTGGSGGKDDSGKPVDGVKPMDVMLLAKALKDLSGTTKDAFAIAKARADARAQAQRDLLAEQAAKLDAMPAQPGVTADTKAAIRAALGIV